jgi:hypothetical protein
MRGVPENNIFIFAYINMGATSLIYLGSSAMR